MSLSTSLISSYIHHIFITLAYFSTPPRKLLKRAQLAAGFRRNSPSAGLPAIAAPLPSVTASPPWTVHRHGTGHRGGIWPIGNAPTRPFVSPGNCVHSDRKILLLPFQSLEVVGASKCRLAILVERTFLKAIHRWWVPVKFQEFI